MSDEVLFEVIDGSIALVTIHRPEQRNAINRAVMDGLRDAWQRIEHDDALRVGILTGSGDKAFCAGMDLKEAAATKLAVPPRDMLPVLGDSVQISKPVIAAVNGAAYAGGWLFAQMCDLCIAADHAVFGITEAKFGRGMPWAAPLVRMLPQRVVMELLLTARPITAQRAHALGYVNDVVPQTELRDRALDMAREIAAPRTAHREGSARTGLPLVRDGNLCQPARSATPLRARVPERRRPGRTALLRGEARTALDRPLSRFVPHPYPVKVHP